jgi:hypothetical protein
MLEVIGLGTVSIMCVAVLWAATTFVYQPQLKTFALLGFGVSILTSGTKFHKNINLLAGTIDRNVFLLLPPVLAKVFKSSLGCKMFSV